jgi:hypothetical protein
MRTPRADVLTLDGKEPNMTSNLSPAERAAFVRSNIPHDGLFAGYQWRISPEPFVLDAALVKQLEFLGRVLLQFYRSVNLLYRESAAGQQPSWIASVLDQGKPPELLELQRSAAFKNDIPRVIRPDILLTDKGISITELDSVPGGIGLTAWLNRTYSSLPADGLQVIGGMDRMLRGFAGIFDGAKDVHIVVSEESATYRPEMAWLAEQLGPRFSVKDTTFEKVNKGDGVYRFFELFDMANVPAARRIFELASDKQIRVTPPPKPVLEEKMLFALLWNRNLRGFWTQHLGSRFFQNLQESVPYTWLVDPAPLPPHAALPELNLTDWRQLKSLSQRERELILKISGFSDKAWGARGVFLGSDLSHADWSAAVDRALESFSTSPFILQRYHKPRIVDANYFDIDKQILTPMPGRVRLCPYYFVLGDGDSARTQLSGILATICPADKKIIHGMTDATLAPCAVRNVS